MCSICGGSGWTEAGPCRECDGPNLPDGWGDLPGSIANRDRDIAELRALLGDGPPGTSATLLREAADKIEGLKEDLKSAVEIAWDRGATEWVRLNYPRDARRLEAQRQEP